MHVCCVSPVTLRRSYVEAVSDMGHKWQLSYPQLFQIAQHFSVCLPSTLSVFKYIKCSQHCQRKLYRHTSLLSSFRCTSYGTRPEYVSSTTCIYTQYKTKNNSVTKKSYVPLRKSIHHSSLNTVPVTVQVDSTLQFGRSLELLQGSFHLPPLASQQRNQNHQVLHEMRHQ